MSDLNEVREYRGQKFLFKVEDSMDYKDYKKYERLRMETWGDPADFMPSERNMLDENFLDMGSALYIAVFVQDRSGSFLEDWEHFVGFSYGFVGIRDKKMGFNRPQYTAVKQPYRKFGLGIAIKEFQKKTLLDVFHIHEIVCTFDPLTGVNAHRNIHCFGMDILEYKEAHYSDYFGVLNREDVPCDRFFASWKLLGKTQRPHFDLKELLGSGLLVNRSEAIKIQGRSGPVLMETVKNVDLEKTGSRLLVEIPYDFYRMLEETRVEERAVREIPVEWRSVTRKVFLELFKRGYEIRDFDTLDHDGRKRNFYVLCL